MDLLSQLTWCKKVSQLVQFGGYRKGVFWSKISEFGSSTRGCFRSFEKEGAMVVKIVKGSPAENGGLKVGDLIVEADGKVITSAADLKNQLGLIRAGASVPIEYFRGKEIR